MSVRHAFRASKDGRSGWCVQFDFDADLVEGIKAWIPAKDREWQPDKKLWWFAKEHENKMEAFLPGFGAFLHAKGMFDDSI